jgi:monoamine oxidase
MARTPLLHRFVQLSRDLAIARQTGVSVEDIRDRRYTRMTRRRLIQGSVAAIGGMAATGLVSRPRPARAASGLRVGIIGGGIAGLTAALVMVDQGVIPTVYEASSRIGGRMHSDTTSWLNGQTSEWCGELIDTGHTYIRSLAQRYGLTLIDRVASLPPGAEPTNYFFGQYYPESQAVADFAPVDEALRSQIKAPRGSTTYNSYNAAGYALDHLSLFDWIEAYVPGGHTSDLGTLLDVAYAEEYGLDTPLQSSLNLVYLLGYQPQPTGFSIFGLSDERYSIARGNQRLPEAIAASLPNGTVRTGWRMVAISTNSDGSVAIAFTTPIGDRVETFDAVLLTLPFSVLRTLDYSRAGFDPLKQTAITKLGYGTNSKLILQFDSRYWRQPGPWPAIPSGETYTDLGYQNTWEGTAGQPGATGIIVDYSGGTYGAAFKPPRPYSTSASSPLVASAAEQFLAQLNVVWPGVSQHYTGRAALSYPTGDPNLLGSYSCWLVGQYTAFAGYEGARQGNVYFAGEHTSVAYQGFMEGGAETGASTARALLRDHGVAISIPASPLTRG